MKPKFYSNLKFLVVLSDLTMNVLSLRINAVKSDENFRISNQVLILIDVEDFWSEGDCVAN